uniref:Tetraacyldisaccharide 4'-kinase n=1 Tax=Candidatus Kentrum eta TaxID=2126337 RepID=A0A450V2J2_9GAMM|nr:MAG: lipid-A-disaccharide kinase [Candidatus Kentron sp. H]VFJ92402.1 MAG: lipid-A-disaccharide kinase [Candidatus Kentron sp. H]VFJ98993.1 MAG: lipid-A-disaccharide kinase [Candidatus Kentron sp. H]
MLAPRISLPALWYKDHHPLVYALTPFSWLFRAAVAMRRLAHGHGPGTVYHPEIPVVVVGNITTGGTGKTPLVIWLAGFLKEHGFRPGIVLRGYGGKAAHWPQWVTGDSDPHRVGDEAVLLARRTRCQVVAAPDRVAAVRELAARTDCNLILSDDGLQHYALGRDVEIAVIDGVLGVGNGRCLPAGPLREPVSRLAAVDLVVVNHGLGPGLGHDLPGRPEGTPAVGMGLIAGDPRPVAGEGAGRSIEAFRDRPAHAVCGIGRPERFFETLRRLGLDIKPHPFPDHYAFRPADVTFGDGLPVLMTEKDAVKCRRLAGPHHWYLPVEARPDPVLGARLLTLL